MLTVVSVLFRPSSLVPSFSRCYSPEWVDKLYRGVERNLSEPFRFVCLVDDDYEFETPEIEPLPLCGQRGGWLHIMEFFRPDVADGYRLFMGLDTVIVGSLDEIAGYRGPLLVPRDPYHTPKLCNAVILVDEDASDLIYHTWKRDERTWHTDIATCPSEMLWMRHRLPLEPDYFNDLYPGQLASYKVHVAKRGLDPDCRIVYFHGRPKPPDVRAAWCRNAWV